MKDQKLFWLHIKKSAGISTRALLSPYYVEVDRGKHPKTFIQAQPEEYNDILNNYRIVLGDYQFKRCLFAKKYLYLEDWNTNYFSFAFSREPTDRCVSMFYYLFWSDLGLRKNVIRSFKHSIKSRKLVNLNASYSFDLFLNHVEEARVSDSIYQPLNNSFTTHTAPMWDDITDYEGNILLKKVYRLEKLVEGINFAFEQCGIKKRITKDVKRLNKNQGRQDFIPSKDQKRKIEGIYSKDFDLYESINS